MIATMDDTLSPEIEILMDYSLTRVITPVCCLGPSWLLLMVVLLLLLPLLLFYCVFDGEKGAFKKVKYSDFFLIRALSLLEANKLRDELASNKFSKRVYVVSYSTHCTVNWILKIEYFVNVSYWGPVHTESNGITGKLIRYNIDKAWNYF